MRTKHDRLGSEAVIIEAPMSFTGSARRVWRVATWWVLRLMDNRDAYWWGALLGTTWVCMVVVALVAIVLAWAVVAVWYFAFGLLVVPWRLIRRGQRKRHAEELRHRELLNA